MKRRAVSELIATWIVGAMISIAAFDVVGYLVGSYFGKDFNAAQCVAAGAMVALLGTIVYCFVAGIIDDVKHRIRGDM